MRLVAELRAVLMSRAAVDHDTHGQERIEVVLQWRLGYIDLSAGT